MLEGVPRIECGPGRGWLDRWRGVGSSPGPGSDRDALEHRGPSGHLDGFVDSRRRLDDEIQANVVARDLLQDGGDETAVAGPDPLAGDPVRHGEAEAVPIEVDGSDVAKPRIPRGLGELSLQGSRRRLPSLGSSGQTSLRNFHSPIHKCGEPISPHESGARNSAVGLRSEPFGSGDEPTIRGLGQVVGGATVAGDLSPLKGAVQNIIDVIR